MAFTHNIQDKDNWNAIRTALVARLAKILGVTVEYMEENYTGLPPVAATGDYATIAASDAHAIRVLQEALITYIGTMTANGEHWARDVTDKDAIEYYTVATVFEDLGLDLGDDGVGFRRVTGNPTAEELASPDFEHGYCTRGDICGPWIWEDMQALLDLLTTTAGGWFWQGETGQNTWNWCEDQERGIDPSPDPNWPGIPSTDGAWADAKAFCEANQHLGSGTASPMTLSLGIFSDGTTWHYLIARYETVRGKVVVPALDGGTTTIYAKCLEYAWHSDNYTYTGPAAVNTWMTVANDTWVGTTDVPAWVAKPDVSGSGPHGRVAGWQAGDVVIVTEWEF